MLLIATRNLIVALLATLSITLCLMMVLGDAPWAASEELRDVLERLRAGTEQWDSNSSHARSLMPKAIVIFGMEKDVR